MSQSEQPVPMCCMCHWYKSLLWNRSLMKEESVQSLAPAEEGTFSVSVHGTLPVVLYTGRHSHRKDVPESVSNLSVCSPFFGVGTTCHFLILWS